MDLQEILKLAGTSLVSSAIVLAGAKYILQKSFDYHLEKLKEENRLLAEENARRKASTYDAQVTSFNKINSLCNRLQSITKEFANQLADEKADHGQAIREAVRDYKSCTQLLNDTILEEGLWFPPAPFFEIRDMKSRTDDLSREAERFINLGIYTPEQGHDLTVIALATSRKVDETIREIIQSHLGVVDAL